MSTCKNCGLPFLPDEVVVTVGWAGGCHSFPVCIERLRADLEAVRGELATKDYKIRELNDELNDCGDKLADALGIYT